MAEELLASPVLLSRREGEEVRPAVHIEHGVERRSLEAAPGAVDLTQRRKAVEGDFVRCDPNDGAVSAVEDMDGSHGACFPGLQRQAVASDREGERARYPSQVRLARVII